MKKAITIFMLSIYLPLGNCNDEIKNSNMFRMPLAVLNSRIAPNSQIGYGYRDVVDGGVEIELKGLAGNDYNIIFKNKNYSFSINYKDKTVSEIFNEIIESMRHIHTFLKVPNYGGKDISEFRFIRLEGDSDVIRTHLLTWFYNKNFSLPTVKEKICINYYKAIKSTIRYDDIINANIQSYEGIKSPEFTNETPPYIDHLVIGDYIDGFNNAYFYYYIYYKNGGFKKIDLESKHLPRHLRFISQCLKIRKKEAYFTGCYNGYEEARLNFITDNAEEINKKFKLDIKKLKPSP